MHSLQSFQLPTVFSSNHTGMDQLFAGPSPDNYNEVRNRTISPSVQVSRDLLVSSTKSSVAYHERMELLWQLLDQCLIEAQAINLTGGISSGEHKLCNSQENSTGNYNSILLTIYISVLGPCYDCTLSYPNVHALSSCPITHSPCIYLKASMPYTYILMSYPQLYS